MVPIAITPPHSKRMAADSTTADINNAANPGFFFS